MDEKNNGRRELLLTNSNIQYGRVPMTGNCKMQRDDKKF